MKEIGKDIIKVPHSALQDHPERLSRCGPLSRHALMVLWHYLAMLTIEITLRRFGKKREINHKYVYLYLDKVPVTKLLFSEDAS